MVEGGTTEYKDNGWHGMYVFSDKFKGDRIYPLGIKFLDHLILGSADCEGGRGFVSVMERLAF